MTKKYTILEAIQKVIPLNIHRQFIIESYIAPKKAKKRKPKKPSVELKDLKNV